MSFEEVMRRMKSRTPEELVVMDAETEVVLAATRVQAEEWAAEDEAGE